MKMGEWIRAARKHAGLSQESLGDRLGVTKGNVSAWENGYHNASYEQILAVSKLTGCPLPKFQNIETAELAAWPFPSISLEAINRLEPKARLQLEAAFIVSAGHLGVDIRANASPKD